MFTFLLNISCLKLVMWLLPLPFPFLSFTSFILIFIFSSLFLSLDKSSFNRLSGCHWQNCCLFQGTQDWALFSTSSSPCLFLIAWESHILCLLLASLGSPALHFFCVHIPPSSGRVTGWLCQPASAQHKLQSLWLRVQGYIFKLLSRLCLFLSPHSWCHVPRAIGTVLLQCC